MKTNKNYNRNDRINKKKKRNNSKNNTIEH